MPNTAKVIYSSAFQKFKVFNIQHDDKSEITLTSNKKGLSEPDVKNIAQWKGIVKWYCKYISSYLF